MQRQQVVVVGAGIGGLATSISLRKAGVEVEIIERARHLAEIGAAISLWPNALAACEELGLADRIRQVGSPELHGGLRSPDGRWIARADRRLVDRHLGGPSILVHRAELQRVLLDAAADIPIHLGSAFTGMVPESGGMRVETTEGTVLRGEAVIGCDGIWSQVRTSMEDENGPAYTGLTGWRAVIENPGTVDASWITVGGGLQFLASPMAAGRLFIAAAVPMEEGGSASIVEVVPFLQDLFAGWHRPIFELLAATPEAALIATDIYCRPPPTRLVRGRVALVGDAAHPMTPDLGQGGCQALEDAVALGRSFSSGVEAGVALARYEACRLRRTRRVVKASAAIGHWMSTESRSVGAMRNTGLGLVPNTVRLRYLARFAGRGSLGPPSG